MKKTRLITALLLVIAGITYSGNNAFSEEPVFYLGGFAGLNYNIHSAHFKELPPVPNCCTMFDGGTGWGFAVGGLFDYPLSRALSLSARIGYSTLNAKLLVHNTNIGYTIENDTLETVVPIAVDHTIDSKIAVISLEPLVNYRFYNNFIGTAGLRLSYVSTAKFSQKEEIISPDEAFFLNSRSKVQNEYNNLDIPDAKSFLAFGVIGLGYELPIGRNTFLIPEVLFYIPFMDISSVTWKQMNLQIGASVKIPIYPPSEKPVAKEKPLVVETPSVLASKLDAYGLDNYGARQKQPTIVIEELEVEEGFPLLSHVFFKEGSSDLNNTNLHLLNNSETSTFNEDSLPWNTIKIYNEVLNIVGSRLQKKPNDKITITGCNNNIGVEENNLALSEQRAAEVKRYLVDVWKISPDRISTKAQNLPDVFANNAKPDGQEENRRAEISSTNFDILKPIYLKEISKKATPPTIEIVPSVTADAGVKHWNIEVQQGNETLRNYKGNTSPNKLVWNVEEKPLPQFETPVKISLNAEDLKGQKTSSSTELTIQQLTLRKKRVELKDDKRIERFSLILFDYDKADIKPNNKIILDNIKSRIKPNSVVTVEGYADRTGEVDYNKQLALRRCEEVQKNLNVKNSNLIMTPVGSVVQLYDNDLPEGRSYCRTVKIKIETPVKE
ncbi:MAG: OmpA family protein [Bacteroidota bacterium]